MRRKRDENWEKKGWLWYIVVVVIWRAYGGETKLLNWQKHLPPLSPSFWHLYTTISCFSNTRTFSHQSIYIPPTKTPHSLYIYIYTLSFSLSSYNGFLSYFDFSWNDNGFFYVLLVWAKMLLIFFFSTLHPSSLERLYNPSSNCLFRWATSKREYLLWSNFTKLFLTDISKDKHKIL